MAFQYRKRTQESAEARATQQGGSFEGFVKDEFRQYGPKNGDNAIRILPRDASEGSDNYGEDIWIHYNVGPDRATIPCPARMLTESCPVCEERMRAERRGDEEAAKDLKPSRRVLVWLIDRKNEDQGPLLWGMPWTVDRDIQKACKDRETGVYYFPEDPEEGYDIYFDRSGNPPFVDYTTFQLSRKPNSVPPKILDYIADHPILDTIHMRDYDQIKRLFDGGTRDSAASPTATASPPAKPDVKSNGSEEPAQPSRPALRRDPVPEEPPWNPEPPAAIAAPKQEPPKQEPPKQEPPKQEPPKQVELPPVMTGAERAAALRARFAARKAQP